MWAGERAFGGCVHEPVPTSRFEEIRNVAIAGRGSNRDFLVFKGRVEGYGPCKEVFTRLLQSERVCSKQDSNSIQTSQFEANQTFKIDENTMQTEQEANLVQNTKIWLRIQLNIALTEQALKVIGTQGTFKWSSYRER